MFLIFSSADFSISATLVVNFSAIAARGPARRDERSRRLLLASVEKDSAGERNSLVEEDAEDECSSSSSGFLLLCVALADSSSIASGTADEAPSTLISRENQEKILLEMNLFVGETKKTHVQNSRLIKASGAGSVSARLEESGTGRMTVRFHAPLAPDVSTRPPSLGRPPERGLSSSSVGVGLDSGPIDVRDETLGRKFLLEQVSVRKFSKPDEDGKNR